VTAEHQNTASFWLPLVKRHNVFVIARQRARATDPVPESVLQSYIDRRFSRVTADVRLDDAIYTTTVFVPKAMDDYAYVLVG
jgi:hypothetical protein